MSPCPGHRLIIGYARVSSAEQANDSYALAQQRARLIAAGAEVVLEDVQSGAKDDRPNFLDLQEKVRRGEIREVIITRLDRITRSLLTLRKTIQLLLDNEVRLRVLDDNIDTSTAAGRFHVNIMGSVAEMELDQLRERVLHGKRFARQQQRHLSCPFGYRLEDGLLLPNDELYRESSKTCFNVARELILIFLNTGNISGTIRDVSMRYGVDRLPGHWSRDFARDVSGFRRWLINPVLRGGLVYHVTDQRKRQEFPEIHSHRLLDEEEYRQVLDLLEAGKRSKSVHNRMINPLAGLIFCKACGSPMFTSSSGTNRKKKHHYIMCTGAYPRTGRNKVCDRRSAYGLEMEQLIELTTEALQQQAALIAKHGIGTVTVADDTPEILELVQQVQRLEALADSDLAEVIFTKQAKIAILRQQLRISAEGELSDKQDLLEWLANPLAWDLATFEELRFLFLKFIDRVDCDKGTVTVKLKFQI